MGEEGSRKCQTVSSLAPTRTHSKALTFVTAMVMLGCDATMGRGWGNGERGWIECSLSRRGCAIFPSPPGHCLSLAARILCVGHFLLDVRGREQAEELDAEIPPQNWLAAPFDKPSIPSPATLAKEIQSRASIKLGLLAPQRPRTSKWGLLSLIHAPLPRFHRAHQAGHPPKPPWEAWVSQR